MQYYKYCLRCGRRLKTDEARRVGFGSTCLEKSRHQAYKRPLIDIIQAEPAERTPARGRL